MSILIKGMSGYECCADCEFCGGLIMPDGIYTCDCPPTCGMNITRAIEEDCRHPDCQLIELPEKHGRLLDENDVIDAIHARLRELQTHKAFIGKHGDIDLLGVFPYIANIKAVVEAEGE